MFYSSVSRSFSNREAGRYVNICKPSFIVRAPQLNLVDSSAERASFIESDTGHGVELLVFALRKLVRNWSMPINQIDQSH